MKTRVISAIIMLIILVPLILAGGSWFNVGLYIVAMFGLKEFLDLKDTKKPLPFFIRIVAYIFLTLLILLGINGDGEVYSLDFKLLSALVLIFLLPAVLYHDRTKYSINDAFYLIGGILFLGFSLSLFITTREMGLKMFLFLIAIPIVTDIFAYITGMLIGKHKLLPEISPNKTWEGLIGGTILSVFSCSMFYITCINPDIDVLKIISITLFLSVLGQLGDLVFSAIKRHFETKDFSNLIPGHGGILDRLDSLIFVMLGFVFFINII